MDSDRGKCLAQTAYRTRTRNAANVRRSHDGFCRFKMLSEQDGETALVDFSHKKPTLENHVPEHVKRAIIELAPTAQGTVSAHSR